jgi:hypothetical protein
MAEMENQKALHLRRFQPATAEMENQKALHLRSCAQYLGTHLEGLGTDDIRQHTPPVIAI